ncbi:hypothetical protein D3C80_2221440 [compost metagenome]
MFKKVYSCAGAFSFEQDWIVNAPIDNSANTPRFLNFLVTDILSLFMFIRLGFVKLTLM